MPKPRIKWRVRGFEELRYSPGVRRELARRADAVASAAGPGYEASTGDGATRARASVRPVTYQAMRSNAKRHTLLRALGAARGDRG